MPRKKCAEAGCAAGARDEITNCCLRHGGGRRCVEPNCVNSARDGYDKCKRHGGCKRCVEIGCITNAIDGDDRCKRHNGGTRCSEFGCGTSARNGTDKCVKHGGSLCVEPGCRKSKQGATNKCIFHGGGVRCTEPGCGSSARGGLKCISHGGGDRCPNCVTWIDSRCANSKYDGYCATCFKQIFPSDPRSKIVYTHTKEIMVRNHINANFDGFIHDTPLYTGNCDCTHRRRIDHRKLIGNTILAIETDEFGHRAYDARDEEIRYDDVYMIHSGKWIFIRFNPDSNISKIDISDKLDKLSDTMEDCIARIERDENTELCEIIKLYC